MIIPFGTLQLTDIEDCEISRKYDDEGFLRVFPQRLVRTVLIRHKVALKCGKLVCLTTQLRWELEEKKVVIFFTSGPGRLPSPTQKCASGPFYQDV